ncbi:MAG TPA: efflux RND transporter permease subunit [bacterium]|nr:efflux RND transporter permease subunit [bacterium]
MTLSDLSIKNPVFAWMIMIGLIVFGWIGFRSMGISQLPDVDFPVVTVSVALEGAAPEVMETQVTDVIEDSVMSIQGIKEVSSTSRQGLATITVEFDLNRDIDVALQEVQTKIAQAQKSLPKEIDPPIVIKTNPEDQPIMWVGLSAKGRPLRDIMTYTFDYLKNQFTTVPGVGEVILGGYIDPNLRVWLDANEMNDKELTVTDVMNAIQLQHQETPAGYIDTGEKEMNVRVMGEANTVEEFRKILIPQRSGQMIWQKFTIGDIGTVEDGLNDVRRISRHMQVPAVGIGIKKQRGSNAVAVARAVKAKLLELQGIKPLPGAVSNFFTVLTTKKTWADVKKEKETYEKAIAENKLPNGMTLKPVFDVTQFIEESTHELNFTLLLSALLTSLVCWLFLGSWSSTLNVLLAIPTSIIGSFVILYFMGFTLNTFTLLGLSLAIGIVVDDAIMVLENIVRYREEGLTRIKAAIVGAREITFAAMAASIAILAIFLPVVFMKGIIGKFFYQFGVTMTAAVMLSLLEALTLAPMRCSQYLQVGSTNVLAKTMDRFMDWMTRGYRRALEIVLNNRWKVIVAALLLFVASLSLTKVIRKEFVPAQDEGRFLVRIQTPIGSSMEFTDNVVKQAETFLASRKDIEQYYVAIGGFQGGEVNAAQLFITLKPYKKRPAVAPARKALTQQQIMGVVREAFNKIPGVERAVVQDLSLSGFSAQRGFPVEFTVRGPDWDKLAELSQKIMAEMKTTGLMEDVDTDYQLGMPEVRVFPSRDQAAARGVSISAIADTVNAMIGGVRVGKYTQNGKRYDIRIRLTDKDRKRPEDINTIWVRNIQGEVIPLSDVISYVEKPTLLSISRRNRERAIGVFANVVPGKSQAEALVKVEEIGKKILPVGYRLVPSGSAQTFQESSDSLMFALLLGIFVAYMVLASQFNSFIHPLTVLMALPFSVTGAFFALVIARNSLNIYSMIGLILLMGIVKKNSILLVDFTNERRKKGASLREALLEACPVRLRPILMTSFATIAGAIPAALGLGPGAETRIPMALVVIGGVLVSTFLTLFVVPCAYSLMGRFESHRHDRDLKEALTELGELPPEAAANHAASPT